MPWGDQRPQPADTATPSPLLHQYKHTHTHVYTLIYIRKSWKIYEWWVWVCSKKTLLTKSGIGWTWPMDHSLPLSAMDQCRENWHLNILSLPIYEHYILLHLFRYHLISLSKVMQFSVNKHCIYLKKSVLNFSVFGYYCKWHFKQFYFLTSLLVQQKYNWFLYIGLVSRSFAQFT